MATVPATPIRNKRDMIEVKEPEIFQFSDRQRILAGVLQSITTVEVKGKETTQYMIQDEAGRRFTFLQTYDMARKIQPNHLGHWLELYYEGEDHSIATQGSPIKKFRVQVSKDKEPGF